MKTLLNSCSIRGSTQKRRINSLGLLMRGLLMQKRRIDPLGLPKQIRQDQRSPCERVPLPSIILPSIRIPAALPCLVFIMGVQSTKPFPASDCFKKGVLLSGDGHQTDPPALPLRLLDGRVLTSRGATVIRRLAPRPVARQIAARGRLCAGRGWSRPGTA